MKIIFYRKENDRCPIEDFISKSSDHEKVEIAAHLDAQQDNIVFTHAFVKKSTKPYSTEIKKAKKYRSDFIRRYKENG